MVWGQIWPIQYQSDSGMQRKFPHSKQTRRAGSAAGLFVREAGVQAAAQFPAHSIKSPACRLATIVFLASVALLMAQQVVIL